MVKNKMRRSIFDLMNNRKIDVEREYERIRKLFENYSFYKDGYSISIYTYIERYFFSEWTKRKRNLSIKDLFESLEIKDGDKLTYNTIDKLLLYIEVMLNLIYISDIEYIEEGTEEYHKYFWDTYELLKENINDLLEDLNYEIKKVSDDELVIVEKDLVASTVAETNKNVSDKVIEYRRFILKGKVDEKREILNLLANEIEGMKPTFKGTTYSNLMDDVQFMLNNLNIRHNNKEGKNKKEYITNISKSKLEELYDKTFDMILSVFVIDKYLKMKNEIDTLKNEIK